MSWSSSLKMREAKKLNKKYQWEVRTMREERPIYVHTTEDSVLAAATAFVEQNGNLSVYSIRKSAEIIEYPDKYEEVS